VTEKRFNLLDEPWLEVVTDAGTIEMVSILDVFRRADQWRGLGQELSTQRFAILRVLLAFLHRALKGPTLEQWLAAWEAGLPLDEIEAYATTVRERFWLVHPTQPFFQTPTLRAAKGPEMGLQKIVADLPDGEQFFTNRSRADVARLAWEEAAVWLIHTHAYDTAGIKTGAVDDRLTVNGKGYGYGLPAWCGQVGGLSAQGRNLRETMLLNLIPTPFEDADQPAWEREVTTSFRGSVTDEEFTVAGPVQLLTWQSRRLLIVWDGTEAVGLTLCQGDRITPQEPPKHFVERMTSWRYSKPQSAKYGRAIFMPQQHDPTQQAWRGLARLLGSPHGHQAAPSDVKVPDTQLIEWLTDVQSAEELDAPPITLEFAGFEYGGQNATYAEVIDDSLGVPAVVLARNEQAEAWRALVTTTVSEADSVAYAVRKFAENLAIASGDDRPELPQWQERTLAAMDGPIRAWLSGLDHEPDLTAAHRAWQITCRKLALGLGDELLGTLGPQAFAGCVPTGESEPITPARAHIWFLRALAKTLPLAAPPTRKEKS